MADAIDHIPTKTKKQDENRFLFVVTPYTEEIEEGEEEDWTGAINSLNKTIKGSVSKLRKKINKKQDGLQSQIADLAKRFTQAEQDQKT